MPTLKPIGHRITFTRIYPKQKKGAIVQAVVPDIPLECRIVDVGAKVTAVKPGQKCLIMRQAGQLCREYGNVLLGQESEVLALL